MPDVTRSDIIDHSAFLPVLREGIHGGFIHRSDLSDLQIGYCETIDWVKNRRQFDCPECGMTHEVNPDEVICTSYQVAIKISDDQLKPGYTISDAFELPTPPDNEYELIALDSSRYIDPIDTDEKTIFFSPDGPCLDA